MKKKAIISGIIIIIIIMICNFVIKVNKNIPSYEDGLKKGYSVLKEKEFIGKVSYVGIDTMNHFSRTIIFQDSKQKKNKFVVQYDKSNLYNFVKEGDSIIKKKGEYKVQIVRDRKNTFFYLDYGIKKNN